MGDTDETVYTAEYLAMAAATLAEDRAKLVAAVLDATAVLEAAVIAMDEWDLD